ncbi:VOC family protein [Paenibacillus silvisoli]|uniref:VOC family protein n=1 Tax=Paenibacillus silvisoli TaxID=3110539 RepID=UPI0028056301|nr:VOC family protein [Paenibacillus silvisoli]
MRIHHVKLETKKLEKLREFYVQTLELPLAEDSENAFTVSIGKSRLTFEQPPIEEGEHESPFYHAAFDVPANKIDEAIQWLRAKGVALTLLPNQTYSTYFGSWDATSIYFDDPAGNIIEFIARHALNNSIEQPFTSASFVNISEIGLVVDDVPAMMDDLKRHYKLDSYKGYDSTFAAVGDEEGLFILSARKRIWLGSNRGAAVYRTEVTIEGTSAAATKAVESYPYKIIVL